MNALIPAAETLPCTIDGFHGGPLSRDGFAVFITIGTGARSLALSYAEERDGSPQIQHLSYECLAPLVLSSGAEVKAMWELSGALDHNSAFFDRSGACAAGALTDWARERGYDAIVALPGAFQGELGYRWAVGTFGEPQALLLDPARVTVLSD